VNRPVFLVPGWQNSGPGHWQSLWESQVADARRVEMPNWDFPRRWEWTGALDDALALHLRFDGAPPVLVGHSVGCLAIVHWAAQHQRPIHGALLVAPADVERDEAPEELRDFAPILSPPMSSRRRTTLISMPDAPATSPRPGDHGSRCSSAAATSTPPADSAPGPGARPCSKS